jgi:Raf kinase inhibitor-like YbhB/YbcL family protein
MALEIHSSAFENGGNIPARYTRDGENISPPLTWTDVPVKTQSFVLIVDDPDAPVGDWVHWLAWNIPANTTSLAEGLSTAPKLASGMQQGVTDYGTTGYDGPCPPSGTHRYFFKLYAVDVVLDVPSTIKKQGLEQAMKGHALAQAVLVGKYSR